MVKRFRNGYNTIETIGQKEKPRTLIFWQFFTINGKISRFGSSFGNFLQEMVKGLQCDSTRSNLVIIVGYM